MVMNNNVGRLWADTKQLQEAPRVHQRSTRNNTPGQLPIPSPVSESAHKQQNSEGEHPNSEGEQPNSEGEQQTTLRNNNKPAPPQIVLTERTNRATRRQHQRKSDETAIHEQMEEMIYTQDEYTCYAIQTAGV
eukprot:scaffold314979_cov30-Attheya_sp.AAC.1